MGVPMNEETGVLTPRSSRRLRHCCCGCTLQTGCIIIGTVTLINALSTLYLSITSLMARSALSYELQDSKTIVHVISLIYGTLQLATALSLIYGADKKRPSLMRFWLYVRYVELVLIICLALYYLVQFALYSSAVAVVAGICGFAFGIGVMIYTISIVHSFCSEVTEEMLSSKDEMYISKF